MKIGDFAKLCKTRISILRHYDKTGLFKPVFIDKFTGYRYYNPEQIKDFELILKFKKLGFSLKEIKKITVSWDKHLQEYEIEKIFDGKIKEFELLILEIKQEKNNLLKLNMKGESINMSNMNNKEINEDINIDDIKFEDDPEAVGKWEIIGEYLTKESFLSKSEPKENNYGQRFKEIYFLPNGQRYWIYGWTKGFIILVNGDYAAMNPYEIYKSEETSGEKYMFVNWKSYDFIKHGGKETVLVLKQSNNKKYTIDEISKKDNIDKPFVDDKKILGKWKAIAHIDNKAAIFNSDYPESNLFFKNMEFKENGIFMRNGNDTSLYASWTKGYLLTNAGNGIEKTAEKYKFKTIDGNEYLFIEWKSGDYIWGGWEPTYYVFVRE